MRIDDFKANLVGGGARPNLFRVRMNFPSATANIIGQVAGAIAGAAGAGVGTVAAGVANLAGSGGPARQMEFLCTAAEIPASTVGLITIPHRGREIKVPGDRKFANLTLKILNDTDFRIRNAFEEWSDLITSHVGNVGSPSLLAISQDIIVEQLDRSGPSFEPTALKTYKFVGAWPSEVGAIALDASSSDAVEDFDVTLEYQYWTSDNTN